MQVLAFILGTVLEPGHEACELLDGLLVGDAPFFGRRQLGVAQHAGLGITAGPGDQRRRAGAEEVDPLEGLSSSLNEMCRS